MGEAIFVDCIYYLTLTLIGMAIGYWLGGRVGKQKENSGEK